MRMQVLAARRGGREALTEMASQNARLVVGYCAKKAELKRLQEALAAERARWEVPAPAMPLLAHSTRITKESLRCLGANLIMLVLLDDLGWSVLPAA